MKIPKISKGNDYYNSKEFYKRCPDLAPKNIYLYNKRTVKEQDIDIYFDKLIAKTEIKKQDGLIKRFVKNLF